MVDDEKKDDLFVENKAKTKQQQNIARKFMLQFKNKTRKY